MNRLFTTDGEYLLISAEQWEQLDAALDVADVVRARELWSSWLAPSWPCTLGSGREDVDDGEPERTPS